MHQGSGCGHVGGGARAFSCDCGCVNNEDGEQNHQRHSVTENPNFELPSELKQMAKRLKGTMVTLVWHGGDKFTVLETNALELSRHKNNKSVISKSLVFHSPSSYWRLYCCMLPSTSSFKPSQEGYYY